VLAPSRVWDSGDEPDGHTGARDVGGAKDVAVAKGVLLNGYPRARLREGSIQLRRRMVNPMVAMKPTGTRGPGTELVGPMTSQWPTKMPCVTERMELRQRRMCSHQGTGLWR